MSKDNYNICREHADEIKETAINSVHTIIDDILMTADRNDVLNLIEKLQRKNFVYNAESVASIYGSLLCCDVGSELSSFGNDFLGEMFGKNGETVH